MTGDEYTEKMDTVTHAVRTFHQLLEPVTDEDLNTLAATIKRAESVGSIFHPSEWMAAEKDQRIAIQWEAVMLAKRVRQSWRAWKEMAGVTP